MGIQYKVIAHSDPAEIENAASILEAKIVYRPGAEFKDMLKSFTIHNKTGGDGMDLS